MPNCIAVPFVGPRARLPAPPYGSINLDWNQLMPLPLLQIVNGTGTSSIAVPAAPALVGIEFGVQAVLTDGTRIHLTPPVYDTVTL